MDAYVISVAVIAFACGLWLGWLRGSAERRSMEEWVSVLREEARKMRLYVLTWIALSYEIERFAPSSGAATPERIAKLREECKAALQRRRDIIAPYEPQPK